MDRDQIRRLAAESAEQALLDLAKRYEAGDTPGLYAADATAIAEEIRSLAEKVTLPVSAIAALHVPDKDDPNFCKSCDASYPCATRKLLDDEV